MNASGQHKGMGINKETIRKRWQNTAVHNDPTITHHEIYNLAYI
jgi:hypothetical protein